MSRAQRRTDVVRSRPAVGIGDWLPLAVMPPNGANEPHGPTVVRILCVGPRALLLELDDPADVLGMYRQIERRRTEGWEPDLSDVVPAARTILLDGVADQRRVSVEIASWPKPAVVLPGGPMVEVPTTYDGEDLGAVASRWQMTEREVVDTHVSITFQVAFCGFIPGFAYLSGLPEGLMVARRANPRVAVPAGSVALAGEYTGIYPRSSPGGWQLIGRTAIELWDPSRAIPSLLTPGMQVRFVEEKSSGAG